MSLTTEHSRLPQGYVQLTEGRVRTTDLVYGSNADGWAPPHAFLVGTAVGEEDMQVARRVPLEPKSSRVR